MKTKNSNNDNDDDDDDDDDNNNSNKRAHLLWKVLCVWAKLQGVVACEYSHLLSLLLFPMGSQYYSVISHREPLPRRE